MKKKYKFDERIRVSDEQTLRARRMREAGKTWTQIAERLGVPEPALIQRLDRVTARRIGIRAPYWLYERSGLPPVYIPPRDADECLLEPRPRRVDELRIRKATI